MRIYEASQEYLKNNIPTIIIAGKEYGTKISNN
jgi:Aconitase A